MGNYVKKTLFILRVLLGWLIFYAGITKVFNPNWSAAGYLQNAKTFAGFYGFLSRPDVLPVVNFMNEWGLTLLGISLIFGIFVKISSFPGAALMMLYYFPVLEFPYVPGAHAFIVDEHIIYAVCLVLLGASDAGKLWGMDSIYSKIVSSFGKKMERIRQDVGFIGAGLDLMGEHAIVTDPDGTILYANKAVQENTGYSLDEVVGKNPGSLWGGNMPKDFYRTMWHTLKEGKRPFIGEVKNKKKSGAEYWQQLIIIPVMDNGGEIRFLIGIEPNIEERNKMESKLKEKFDSVKDFNNFILNNQLELASLKNQIENLKRKLSSN